MGGGGGVGVPDTSEALSVCLSHPVYIEDCCLLYRVLLVENVVIEQFLQVKRLLLLKFSEG